jgi:hypothetical protein
MTFVFVFRIRKTSKISVLYGRFGVGKHRVQVRPD